MINSSDSLTDTLLYKNGPIAATVFLSSLAVAGTAVAFIALAPIAVNVTATEIVLSKLNAFQISQDRTMLVMTGFLLLGAVTIVTAFFFLPTTVAIIFGIGSIVIIVNNLHKIDSLLEGEPRYTARFKTQVEKEDAALKKDIQKCIDKADEKSRTENEKSLKEMAAYLDNKESWTKTFATISKKRDEIMKLRLEIARLSSAPQPKPAASA